MANRSYLYSLSNCPTSYSDRPETISGLSEWGYDVPIAFRVLASGGTRLCASLISDGMAGEPEGKKTRLFALCGEFAAGHARWRKLDSILRAAAGVHSKALVSALDETKQFLETHTDHNVLLETIELDVMSASSESELRACVEREMENCLRAGAAVDELSEDVVEGAAQVQAAARNVVPGPLSVFHGLCFDDAFDDVRSGRAKVPLGISWWSDVLYFSLWNRQQFEASR
jgi:hypothetical protein